MYDHDPDEVTQLGWEEFILRQWELIFTGYRTWTGLRTQGRRWTDLIEAGLGCSRKSPKSWSTPQSSAARTVTWRAPGTRRQWCPG